MLFNINNNTTVTLGYFFIKRDFKYLTKFMILDYRWMVWSEVDIPEKICYASDLCHHGHRAESRRDRGHVRDHGQYSGCGHGWLAKRAQPRAGVRCRVAAPPARAAAPPETTLSPATATSGLAPASKRFQYNLSFCSDSTVSPPLPTYLIFLFHCLTIYFENNYKWTDQKQYEFTCKVKYKIMWTKFLIKWNIM